MIYDYEYELGCLNEYYFAKQGEPICGYQLAKDGY